MSAETAYSSVTRLSQLIDDITQTEARFEEKEPLVRAFVPEEGRFERLRQEVQGLPAQYQKQEDSSELVGQLIGIKDIFHVAGMPTRAGSRLPPEKISGGEAASVTRLKAAGCLILGKTVTTEFAYFSPGPTRNPHNLEHTPGGSSSGSAAAVAAGLCSLALGTQTIGSIIRPAAFCGVVGLKPSYGRVSREGVVPLSPSLDHVGFFTPDVSMARVAAPWLYQDWLRGHRPLRRPVLGIPEGPYMENASREALTHFQETCQHLIETGYEIRRVLVFQDYPEIVKRHNLILAGEAARVHQDWFRDYSHLYSSHTAALIRNGQGIPEVELAEARDGIAQLRVTLTSIMVDHKVDLWISPAAPGPAPKGLESTGDPVMNLPWTQAGLPTINLPAGFSNSGLPLGLQVTAGWYGDEALLDWAVDLERALK